MVRFQEKTQRQREHQKGVCDGPFFRVGTRVSVLADGQTHNGVVARIFGVNKKSASSKKRVYYYNMTFDEESDGIVRCNFLLLFSLVLLCLLCMYLFPLRHFSSTTNSSSIANFGKW